jgi:uncharacterized membrane protein
MGAAVLLIVAGTSIWVLFDAPNHYLSRSWALGCLALWIVAFPWYLFERSKAPDANGAAIATASAPPPPPPPPPPVAAPAAPSGWYPDPWTKEPYRFWDGVHWTHHTSEDGRQAPEA